MNQIQLHPRLAKLPVSTQIDQVPFDKNFCAIAECGSGKTMVLAAYEHLVKGKRVIMRQPSRTASRFVKSGLRMFWGDKMTVGISTRDEKENLDGDVVVCSDGSIMSLIGEDHENVVVYFDEVHLMHSVSTEVELAICKHLGIPVRLMSATMDPSIFKDYFQDEGLEIIELSGRTYPVTTHIVHVPNEAWGGWSDEFIEWLEENVVYATVDDDARSLVFLPTKDMCDKAAEMWEDELDTLAVHGEINPMNVEEWCNERKETGEPYIVFATIVAATSITIDVDRVYIYDKQFYSNEVEGMTIDGHGRIEDNMLIQMAGRAGRIKPGDAYLMTPEPDQDTIEVNPRTWENVKPRPIRTPAAHKTPFEVILSMAHEGYGAGEIDLISNITLSEMKYAEGWLQRNDCITEDHKLTARGRVISGLNLPIKEALLALIPNSSVVRRAVLASLILNNRGPYYMCRIKPGTKAHINAIVRDPGFEIVPSEYVEGAQSLPMVLYNIMRDAVAHKSGGDRDWADEMCDGTNLKPNIIRFAVADLEHALQSMGSDLQTFDIDETLEKQDAFKWAMVRHPDFQPIPFYGNQWSSIQHAGDRIGAVVDSVASAIFGDSLNSGKVLGIPTVKVSNVGNLFATIGWCVKVD